MKDTGSVLRRQEGKIKTVIVTGGAGFIGSHLAELLVARGYRVVILDDLSTGKKANLEQLLKKAEVEFIQGSIIDLPLLQQLFQGVTCVFHEAALTSVLRSIENPVATNDININGTLNVLLAARDNKVHKVIYASSASVYGDSPQLPKVEEMAVNPLSPYAVSKLSGEHYCRVFSLVYNLPTVCLRYFNVYGPRQDPDSQYAAAIPRFITAISQNQPPTIFGDGEQTRDFIFVRDVAEANILAAESDASGVFNIARGERVTVNRLIELIIKLTRHEVKPLHSVSMPGDIRHSVADISRARQFGYNPGYSLEQGLMETIKHFYSGE